jgi:mRNA-degrading endonuclease RelE of RelBE toxin-antitoxin system
VACDIVLLPRAKRELDRVPRNVFHRIDAAISALRHTPRPFGIQTLEGDLHRIRIGDWRILFDILDPERRLVIYRVIRRSEKTYKHLS